MLLALAVVASAAYDDAVAKQPHGQGSTAPLFDRATIETVKGEVLSVERVPRRRGEGLSVRATLKTERETIPVHIGPDWFLARENLVIAPKDTLEVRGSRVTVAGHKAIIAMEVTKEGRTLTLRDASGTPVWRGKGPSRR